MCHLLVYFLKNCSSFSCYFYGKWDFVTFSCFVCRLEWSPFEVELMYFISMSFLCHSYFRDGLLLFLVLNSMLYIFYFLLRISLFCWYKSRRRSRTFIGIFFFWFLFEVPLDRNAFWIWIELVYYTYRVTWCPVSKSWRRPIHETCPWFTHSNHTFHFHDFILFVYLSTSWYSWFILCVSFWWFGISSKG